MPAFWHWFVAAGTILFIIWCIWLVSWSAKQGPQGIADEDLVGHKWDGDLEEWNNPAPKWWLYLYFITVFWAVGYMIAYPGLGNYPGMLGWSQVGQYEAERDAAAERFEPIYARFAEMDFAVLAAEPDAQKLGASLYASYCTTCHGSDARGAPGYPNLADDKWLWGNSEQQLTTSIASGRTAIMPALGASLGGDENVDNMVSYVRSLSGLVEPDEATRSAQPMFATVCSVCHGTGGTGNQMLGAPDLTDDVWLYGNGPEDVRATIMNGRNGIMPPHGDLLGEHRTKILAAYIASLSGAE
jgi:cytochrome c oxidase cbb3-type subunit 3